jgi:hypothetical protein
MKTALALVFGIAIVVPWTSASPNAQAQNLSQDTDNWDQNGFGLTVKRSNDLSDLIFSWECRSPSRYDTFNVRVRISNGKEGQVEVKGGTRGSYREKNAIVGATYTFMVQGCHKGTFGSKCTKWSELKYRNVRHKEKAPGRLEKR